MAGKFFTSAYRLDGVPGSFTIDGAVTGNVEIRDTIDGPGDNLNVLGDIVDDGAGILSNGSVVPSPVDYYGESVDDQSLIIFNGAYYFLFTNDSNLLPGSVVAESLTPFVLSGVTEHYVAGSPLPVDEDQLLTTGVIVYDADAEAAGRTVTTVLSVAEGTLTVDTVAGGANVSGSGTDTVTLTGTVAQINATIADSDTITYRGDADFNGTDTLKVETTDIGNGSDQPASSATDSVDIEVAAVNDAPVAAVPVTISVTEDTAVVVTGISFSDVDAGLGAVTVTLSVTSGTLSAVPTSNVTVGGSATVLTLSGAIADINSLIAASSVTFTPASDSATDVVLTTVINDGGNSGSGGGLTDTATTILELTAVNDAPVITSNSGGTTATIAYAENSTGPVTTVVATDVDGPSVTYSVTGADAGLFTIDATTGILEFVASPDFEAPADANVDNAYQVTVTASDGTLSDTQALTINVTDVNEVIPGAGGPTGSAPTAPIPTQTVGTSGPDVLSGTAGSDTVAGGLGNDVLFGNQGADELNGNQGNDTVRGGQGDDLVRGGQGDDEVQGDRGNDQVFGDNGNDNVNGNQGADTVNGGMGNDTVHGGQDNDEVRGGQGDDFVFGDLGDDQIWGDLGNDTLSGGAGADVFQFAASSGNDVIVDFNRAEGDTLNFDDQTYTVADVNGSAVFTLSGGGTVVLTGVSSASLDAGAFA